MEDKEQYRSSRNNNTNGNRIEKAIIIIKHERIATEEQEVGG